MGIIFKNIEEIVYFLIFYILHIFFKINNLSSTKIIIKFKSAKLDHA